MNRKFMAFFLAMSMAMAMFLTVAPNSANAYYIPPGYTFYSLPAGFQYYHWNNSPVIINSITGEIVTIPVLRNWYPNYHFSIIPPPPLFRRYVGPPPYRPHIHHAPPPPRPRIHHAPPHHGPRHNGSMNHNRPHHRGPGGHGGHGGPRGHHPR